MTPPTGPAPRSTPRHVPTVAWPLVAAAAFVLLGLDAPRWADWLALAALGLSTALVNPQWRGPAARPALAAWAVTVLGVAALVTGWPDGRGGAEGRMLAAFALFAAGAGAVLLLLRRARR